MRNKWLKTIFLLGIVIVLCFVTVYILKDKRVTGKKAGSVVGTETKMEIGNEIDSYKDVKVYYNGNDYTQAYGKNYSEDGYYYGQKWQCVEFIKRFFYQAKKHKMLDVYGNAKDFFDSNIGQGALNKRRGLVQYRNGGNVKPEPDDLMVFTDTSFGHVAIITEVTSDYVKVIQQNVDGKTREKYEIVAKGNQYYIGTKRKPAGWLRKK